MNAEIGFSKSMTRLPRRLAESHPYLWKCAWETFQRAPFLLPHDKSYFALRHFIAASPGGLFLDVGANDGISVLSFRKFDKTYRVFSLEPNVLHQPRLQKMKLRDSNFEYKMVGAGSTSCMTELFFPVFKGVVLHTFCSRNRDQVLPRIEQVFGRSVAEQTEVQSVEGKIVQLDELRLDPTIIKIDTEGFDYDVLLGSQATVARARPFIMVEFWSSLRDTIKKFFDENDYEMLDYDRAEDRFRYASTGTGVRNIFGVPREKQNLFIA
jgi:FkbM family methyltransferase